MTTEHRPLGNGVTLVRNVRFTLFVLEPRRTGEVHDNFGRSQARLQICRGKEFTAMSRITGNGGFLLIVVLSVVMGTEGVIDKLSGCLTPKMEPSLYTISFTLSTS